MSHIFKQNYFWVGLILILIFTQFYKHKPKYLFSYKSELWADRSGYNVYLPALFIYDFDGRAFPEKITEKIGEGFKTDSILGKVLTKYSYGTALCEAPFWLIAHLLSKEKDGYSYIYQKSLGIAAIFFLITSLIWWFKMLIKKYSRKITYISLLFVLFGTSLFYYTSLEPGMSHVYSFFAFTGLLYFLSLCKENEKTWYFILLAFFSALIIIIRPLNVVFIGILFLFEYPFFKNKILLTTRLFWFLAVHILLFFPQLLYYKYASGQWLTNPYQGEGFSNIFTPKTWIILFSPNNGLFIYTPLILLLVVYAAFNSKKSLAFLSFLAYGVIYSAWGTYNLGCSFSHRAFTDLLPFFVPFIPALLSKRPQFIGSIFAVCSLYTLHLAYNYDYCIYLLSDWDWASFFKLVSGFNPL